MPRRGRRKNARVDMQVSDTEMEVVEEDPVVDDEPEVIVDDEEEDMLSESKEDELEDEDQPEEEEEEEEEEESLSSPAAEASGPRLAPRLRIKLKLPAHASGASSAAQSATGASTPTGSVRRRRALSQEIDIESEDSEDEDGSTRSTSVATPGRPLTARQAVLRNVVDASHVSLSEPPNPRKKKPLTEIELALKREETARKRRNLSEKKLEDEKAETINRLLKKQSRSKGRRNALSTAEDRPTPGAGSNHGDAEMEDGEEIAPAVPTMYRWISTSKTTTTAKGENEQPTMTLTFSVPVTVMRAVPSSDNAGKAVEVPPSKPHCDVEGCDSPRKYRLVRDWQKGACGMSHLKVLAAQATPAA
ncbi:hypothetical protein NM688_g2972 [Phlebia brevispora]|uniref:Uncharacterized protein n=1 Tax=Phlebia brevispora TaxID=194682 RepID=A0ACC1T706_9APHY|nr:hypothetical protein NM688_g2972 [Phlebia brevispora]